MGGVRDVEGVHVVVGVDHRSLESAGDEAAGGGLGQAFGGPAKQWFDFDAELFFLVPECGVEVPRNRGVPCQRKDAQTFLMASKEMGQGLISEIFAQALPGPDPRLHSCVCTVRRYRRWRRYEACCRHDPGNVLGVHFLGRCLAGTVLPEASGTDILSVSGPGTAKLSAMRRP